MMVHVLVSPREPVAAAHFAKDGMGSERRTIGEFSDPAQQGGTVGLPIRGRCSSAALLDLRPRRDAVGPGERGTQRDPFHDGAMKKGAGGARISGSGAYAEGVIEMTHHLVRGHPAPPGFGG